MDHAVAIRTNNGKIPEPHHRTSRERRHGNGVVHFATSFPDFARQTGKCQPTDFAADLPFLASGRQTRFPQSSASLFSDVGTELSFANSFAGRMNVQIRY